MYADTLLALDPAASSLSRADASDAAVHTLREYAAERGLSRAALVEVVAAEVTRIRARGLAPTAEGLRGYLRSRPAAEGAARLPRAVRLSIFAQAALRGVLAA